MLLCRIVLRCMLRRMVLRGIVLRCCCSMCAGRIAVVSDVATWKGKVAVRSNSSGSGNGRWHDMGATDLRRC